MFGDYVLKQAAAEYNNRILLIDDEGLDEATHYSADFQAHGFEVVHYTDDLTFRIEYEGKLKSKRTSCWYLHILIAIFPMTFNEDFGLILFQWTDCFQS